MAPKNHLCYEETLRTDCGVKNRPSFAPNMLPEA